MVNTMTTVTVPEAAELPAGAKVDVRSRYLGTWSHGFEVVGRRDQGYEIRRVSDGSILPELLDPDEVRLERRKQGTWWF